MKRVILSIASLMLTVSIFAQSPESFTYQAIVRDNTGQPLPNTAVTFQFNILQGSASGTTVYSENHSATTNDFGLVNLQIGQGTVNSGNFSTIDWGNDSYFLNIQIDQGSGFVDMGTQQFISVPYALYAKSAGNGGITYTAGNGISITGNVIENTAPDQTVTIAGQGATTVTGTYPNFTISSTDNVDDADADATNEIQNLSQVLQTGNNAGTNDIDMNNQSITNAHILGLGSSNANYLDMYWGNIRDYNNSHGFDGQVLTVHGTNPNTYVTWDTPNVNDNDADSTNEIQTLSVFGNQLTISGSGGNTVTMQVAAAGNSGDVQLNDNGSIGADPDLHWDFNGKKFTVGQSTDDGRMIVQQDANAPDSIPILEVKNKLGQTIFVVYPDSVHVFIDDSGAKGALKGGFAVSGRSGTKAITNDYLLVRPDSTRIWTSDSIAGFGVRDLSGGTETGYMHITPYNYFIGENSGENLTTGLYNSTFGYQSGEAITAGNRNVFLGYQAGLSNTKGDDNVFIGNQAGITNTAGWNNVVIGSYAGISLDTAGYNNIIIGKQAGQHLSNGIANVFIGTQAGNSTTTGLGNIFIGDNAGLANDTGYNNIFMGSGTGSNNTYGANNIFLGTEAGLANTTGGENIFIGFNAGHSNTIGQGNNFIGYQAGFSSQTGNENCYLGFQSGYTSTVGDRNIFIGYHAAYASTGGGSYQDNIIIGDSAGLINGNYSNIFIGNNAGQNNTQYENIYIGNNCGKNGFAGQYNTYIGTDVGLNSTGSLNTFIGSHCAPNNALGEYNVFMGTDAGFGNTDGSHNVFIGESAGSWNTIGNYNTFIGENSGGTSNNLENATCLGYNVGIVSDNTVRIGNSAVISIGGYAAWTNISDKRFKKDIQENVPGLDFILKLKPVTYHLDMESIAKFNHTPDSLRMKKAEMEKENQLQTGFLAQDVEKAAQSIGFNFSGIDAPKNENDNYGLRYAEFVVPLVKAVQEQQQIIEQLKQEINSLKTKNQEMEQLKKRIEQLEKAN